LLRRANRARLFSVLAAGFHVSIRLYQKKHAPQIEKGLHRCKPLNS
jgi:hypothetical protein